MPDDSLIDEMRAALRGDIERAEARGQGQPATAPEPLPIPPMRAVGAPEPRPRSLLSRLLVRRG